jgi:iron complex transport system substrate-binding protein
MRICSLLPSATEIVSSLGLADALVAVSEECDWPAHVREPPIVTASRVDTNRLPASRSSWTGRHGTRNLRGPPEGDPLIGH